jgi:polysaccharide export outer membrane protein
VNDLPTARRRRAPLAAAALAAVLGLCACRATDKNFVWVDTLPGPPSDGVYLIGEGDQLSVRVFGQEGMSASARVRPDGMITLPFVSDVEAAGLTPPQLAQRIQARLKDLLVNPAVTFALQETRPLEISVLGEVQKAGIYRLEPGAGVLTALAAASGFSDYADRDRIFVVRSGTQRIRFTYAALSQARERAAQFRLRPGDVVVVE